MFIISFFIQFCSVVLYYNTAKVGIIIEIANILTHFNNKND